MSIFSSCSIIRKNASETACTGHSLAQSLYSRPLTVLLTGELGAGKTTFAKGFAAGLGVQDNVVSPTYALEQRYKIGVTATSLPPQGERPSEGDVRGEKRLKFRDDEHFIHIDLYRLERKQAEEFLMHSDEHAGVRLIEWAERIDRKSIGPHIHVHIEDRHPARWMHCDFRDEPVPEESEIDEWRREVHLPPHIQAHCEAVATVADALGARLMERRGWLLRPQALHAAARLHDLLRFLDFRTWEGDALYTPTEEDIRIWKRIKVKYDLRHEAAAAAFLTERGFDSVGAIIRTHRGDELPGNSTTEQRLLAYADKRVSHDRIVTLDERFDEFIRRCGNHEKTRHAEIWREAMRKIERELFGEEPSLTDAAPDRA